LLYLNHDISICYLIHSVLNDESEEKFYSMHSSPWGTGQHDILPPLEEPQLPADMIGIKKPSLLTQGFGNVQKFNTAGTWSQN